jgi:hypothetical protein
LTGSATTLGFAFALTLLPMVVASPVAGSLVDRWGTWHALLVSNVGKMVVTLILAALLFADAFAVWHVYVVVTTTSVLSALEIPAFATLAPLLVPQHQLGRPTACGVFAMAASEVLAPVPRALDVGRDVGVATYDDRSIDAVTAMLAVLKAGGFYVPLDVSYPGTTHPRHRGGHATARVPHPDSLLSAAAEPHRRRWRCHAEAKRGAAGLSAHDSGDLRLAIDSHDLGLVLHTSGSAGQPKGVAMHHGALRRICCANVGCSTAMVEPAGSAQATMSVASVEE